MCPRVAVIALFQITRETVHHESRRSFLERVARCGALPAIARLMSKASPARAAQTPATLPALGTRPSMGPIDRSMKSIVANIRAEPVTAGQDIHQHLLRDMVVDGLQLATGTDTPAEAWNSMLKSDDVIVACRKRIK